MSTCISRHGEYGSHEHDESGDGRFICSRCFVFDEDGALEAIDAAEERAVRAERELAELRADNERLVGLLGAVSDEPGGSAAGEPT